MGVQLDGARRLGLAWYFVLLYTQGRVYAVRRGMPGYPKPDRRQTTRERPTNNTGSVPVRPSSSTGICRITTRNGARCGTGEMRCVGYVQGVAVWLWPS
jgi:hypothetical protein